jgi:hypothetical protein
VDPTEAERNLGIFRVYLHGRLLPFSPFHGCRDPQKIQWVHKGVQNWKTHKGNASDESALVNRLVGSINFAGSARQFDAAKLTLNSHKEALAGLEAFFSADHTLIKDGRATRSEFSRWLKESSDALDRDVQLPDPTPLPDFDTSVTTGLVRALDNECKDILEPKEFEFYKTVRIGGSQHKRGDLIQTSRRPPLFGRFQMVAANKATKTKYVVFAREPVELYRPDTGFAELLSKVTWPQPADWTEKWSRQRASEEWPTVDSFEVQFKSAAGWTPISAAESLAVVDVQADDGSGGTPLNPMPVLLHAVAQVLLRATLALAA